jgi:hypothetical protein
MHGQQNIKKCWNSSYTEKLLALNNSPPPFCSHIVNFIKSILVISKLSAAVS